MNNLINKINHWADNRGLKQADPKIQWMRITEEVGEIRDVLLKPTKFTEPQAALKDAIGDTLVTIIVLAHQLDLDVTECLGIAYEEIKNRNRPIETVVIHKADNAVELHGEITGKEMVGKLYTIDCGAYGKFLASKEQYDSVNIGDDIPSYLKGRGQ